MHTACSTLALTAASDSANTIYFHKTLTAAKPLLKTWRVYTTLRTAAFADTVA